MLSLESLSPAAWDALLSVLAGSAFKATAVLTAAFAAALLLRRASASFRHLVWSAATICLLLLPLASLVLPDWPVAVPAGSEIVRNVLAASSEQSARAAGTVVLSVADQDASEAIGGSVFPSPAVLWIAIWAAGFCLMVARVGIGVRRVTALVRNADKLDTGEWTQAAAQLSAELSLRRKVSLLRSDRVSIPMTAGFAQPVILLPADAGEYPAERRWVVLAHELLHVRRGDYLLWMLARLACSLYWFHPLVWLAAARLRQEAEQACDDGVLRLGANAPAYAEQLVLLARGWSPARAAESSAMAMAQPSQLESRIRALLDPARDRREVSRGSRLTVALAAILMLAPLAAVRAPAQATATSLQGTISDISGGRLPGAFVTLQRAGDQSKANTTTNDAGEFAFTSLPAGEYVIEVRKPGFLIQQQSVRLQSGARESLDLTIPMGSVYETINIVGKSSAAQPRPGGPPRRIRVGGNVQQSKLLTMIKPIYPDELQREGVAGMVVLDAVILMDGSLGNVHIASNLVDVDQRLADAAMEAVRFWRYQPTLLNGEPVEVVTTITVNFQLER